MLDADEVCEVEVDRDVDEEVDVFEVVHVVDDAEVVAVVLVDGDEVFEVVDDIVDVSLVVVVADVVWLVVVLWLLDVVVGLTDVVFDVV